MMCRLKVKGKEVSGQEATLNQSQSSIGMPDGDLSDTMSISGKIGQKGDFDRRQKKKWVYDIFSLIWFTFVSLPFLN